VSSRHSLRMHRCRGYFQIRIGSELSQIRDYRDVVAVALPRPRNASPFSATSILDFAIAPASKAVFASATQVITSPGSGLAAKFFDRRPAPSHSDECCRDCFPWYQKHGIALLADATFAPGTNKNHELNARGDGPGQHKPPRKISPPTK